MDPYETERKQLRHIQSQFEQAVADNNIQIMREFVHEDFSFVSFSDRAFKDFESFCQRWEQTRSEMVGLGVFTTRLLPESTRFIGDMAVTYGSAKNDMRDKHGDSFSFDAHWTVIFKKEGDYWKVLRGHNSIDPFGNPMLKAGVKQAMKKYIAAAFLLGAVVGGLLSGWNN
jgi:ketosteroid isomerase-like protein